jgi:fimbrial chaperone protein
MHFARTGLAVFLGLLAAASPSGATSLQISPVRLDLPAKAAASKITLRNMGEQAVRAQVRIFKWTQVNGKDQLVQTRDVVASPPIIKLEPGKNNVIRVVRTAKQPVATEEAYRLIVDELPQSVGESGKTISFVLRYSIPVFFAASDPGKTDLAWSVEARGKQTTLVVANPSNKHARITDLAMTLENGKKTSFGSGLIGYVLANSTTRFTFKQGLKGAAAGDTIMIVAQNNDEPVKAAAKVRAAD